MPYLKSPSRIWIGGLLDTLDKMRFQQKFIPMKSGPEWNFSISTVDYKQILVKYYFNFSIVLFASSAPKNLESNSRDFFSSFFASSIFPFL